MALIEAKVEATSEVRVGRIPSFGCERRYGYDEIAWAEL
jgi:hypothetical protein